MRKVKIMPILMALITVLAGCDNREEPSTKAEKASDTAQASAVETTEAETTVTEASTKIEAVAEPAEETLFKSCGASNLVNSGICCTDGDCYYYSDTNTQKLYQTKNGTADVIADQFYGYYLNLCGDIIYYADAAADNCVTAYDLTSGNRSVICNMHVQELTLYKEKLYFTCTDGKQRTIYRMNTDGSCLESLASCEDLWYMTIYKDVVYYVNYENDQYAIISMNLDGTESRIIRKYNASDLCIAEDKIFFAERDTRYLYSMNLDGSDVQQLNSTYSRCINYMNGQLYYYGSEENGRNIYSCDLGGNITGRYASGAKFLMLMEDELYYYDWDEVLHILPLSKNSEDENTSYGTNIVSYEQEEILKPIRLYIQNNWTGYTLDESNITKKGNIWTILLTESDGSKQYQLIIDLTTGKITILCITEDILPVSVYLYDNATVQLSEEEMEKIASLWCGEHYYEQCTLWQMAYHDYDKNGTYEAFVMCGPITSRAVGDTNDYNILDAVLFISSSGEITVMEDGYQDMEFLLFDGTEYIDNYIEYSGKGYYLPKFFNGFKGWNVLYSVKNDKPYIAIDGGYMNLDDEGDLTYYPGSGSTVCPYCTGWDKNGNRVEDPGHKHILLYDEKTDDFEVYVKYESGDFIKFDDLVS
ncbi:MAG: DUF5050 domain-containing protein [Oscillospiraceae bacterium]